MKLKFFRRYEYEKSIDIDVEREPTPEEAEEIENDIYKEMERYAEEEDKDFEEFDEGEYYDCICRAVKKHVPLEENRVVETFYLLY